MKKEIALGLMMFCAICAIPAHSRYGMAGLVPCMLGLVVSLLMIV